jgi:hypothetical protein
MIAILRRMLAGEAVTQETSGLSKREWREMMEMLGYKLGKTKAELVNIIVSL